MVRALAGTRDRRRDDLLGKMRDRSAGAFRRSGESSPRSRDEEMGRSWEPGSESGGERLRRTGTAGLHQTRGISIGLAQLGGLGGAVGEEAGEASGVGATWELLAH